MIKKSAMLMAFLINIALFIGCSSNSSDEKVNLKSPSSPNNPSAEKPQAVLPVTSYVNWKDQMSIEWLVTDKKNNTQKCRRLTFNASNSPGNDNFVIQSSKLSLQKKCLPYDPNAYSVIYFESETLKVIMAETCIDASMNKCKDITYEIKNLSFIVNNLQDSFSGISLDIKWNDITLPLVKNINNQVFYLNKIQSPLHAFAVQWENQFEKTTLIDLKQL